MRQNARNKRHLRRLLCGGLTGCMLLTAAGGFAEAGSFILPAGVKIVESEAFFGNAELTKLVIPEGTTELKSGAFAACTRLREVVFPVSLKTIAADAFGSFDFTATVAEGSPAMYYCWENGIACNIPLPEEVQDGYRYFVQSDGSCLLTGYTGAEQMLDVPGQLGGHALKKLAARAFAGSTDIRIVNLPESVTEIGEGAFQNMSALTDVALPSKLKEIFAGLFSGCGALESVNLPDGVTAIGEGAFRGCAKLTLSRFPEGLTEIGAYAFSYCAGLTQAMLPDGLRTLGQYAFSKCTGLTRARLPEGLTEAGSGTFFYCSGLKTVSLPESLRRIGTSMFYNCTSLPSAVVPSGVTEIDATAFKGCASLASLIVPASVTEIGAAAFDGCPQLIVSAPEGSACQTYCTAHEIALSAPAVSDFETRALADGSCEITDYLGSESRLSIPARLNGRSVTRIGSGAFRRMSGLKEVHIPSGVTAIGSEAFRDCYYITDIELPDGLLEIGARAFYGCSYLQNINLPESVQTFGDDLFVGCEHVVADEWWHTEQVLVAVTEGSPAMYYCWANGVDCNVDNREQVDYGYDLEYTVLSDGSCEIRPYDDGDWTRVSSVMVIPEACDGHRVTAIDASAFSGCESLATLKLPASLRGAIGEAAFEGTALTGVSLPKGVTTLGASAFAGCASLTGVNLPEGLTRIGASAFENCAALKRLILPDSTVSIGTRALANCAELYNLTLPASLTQIGAEAFAGCGVGSLTLPQGMTRISDNAFRSSNLSRINLPDGLKVIEDGAFVSCNALYELMLPNGVTDIGQDAFENCEGLTTVRVPASVDSIGSGAFDNCPQLTVRTPKNSYCWYSCKSLNIPVEAESKGAFSYNLLADGSCEITGCEGNAMSLSIPATIDGYSVSGIEDGAFEWWDYDGGKSPLISVTFPKTLKRIGESAFRGNELRSVSIPASVEEIGFAAFSDNSALSAITVVAGSSAYRSMDGVLFSGDGTQLIFYPAGKGTQNYAVPEGVQEIASGAFMMANNLRSIALPSGVETLGEEALCMCDNLLSLTVPASVTALDGFNNACESLTVYAVVNSTCWNYCKAHEIPVKEIT